MLAAGRSKEVERRRFGFGLRRIRLFMQRAGEERGKLELWGNSLGGSEARRAEEGAAALKSQRVIGAHREGQDR